MGVPTVLEFQTWLTSLELGTARAMMKGQEHTIFSRRMLSRQHTATPLKPMSYATQ
jgi:hypothetical protein